MRALQMRGERCFFSKISFTWTEMADMSFSRLCVTRICPLNFPGRRAAFPYSLGKQIYGEIRPFQKL